MDGTERLDCIPLLSLYEPPDPITAQAYRPYFITTFLLTSCYTHSTRRHARQENRSFHKAMDFLDFHITATHTHRTNPSMNSEKEMKIIDGPTMNHQRICLKSCYYSLCKCVCLFFFSHTVKPGNIFK